MNFLKGYRTVLTAFAVAALPAVDWALNTGVLKAALYKYEWGEVALSAVGLLFMWLRFLTTTPVGVSNEE